ncbi:MAG: nitrous oxide reductase accessory protein NosL [Roseovarius sp.]|uniref:nitrous oxide reductase accessory protein NosL n=1 Tax=Roseovarius sp. TaxID=1486281 RepID=UPI001B424098|nr:nitrous oxide reductase accessory protein NosL [Roseovarius sp.]MBQ0750098.1 nitrous oxide reductase accessory protein NosL [Roseovarius sp.]MBQ0811428.1 nitrous oxide reductase accessory protein NosL [Roseovarius sp.]
MKWLPLLFLAIALAACKEEVATRPDPVSLTAEAVGHYCQMDLLEHPGPKAQVHLEGLDHPLFFSQVRDAIAYQRMPEQSHAITAIYVNDMAVAASWEHPGAENWIDATAAHYVIGSDATGGMDAPELVPFLTAQDATAFAEARGGHVLRLAEVADADVLSAVPIVTSTTDRAEEDDFEARLNQLSRERQN